LNDAERLPRFRQSRDSVGTNTYNLKLFYGRFHGPLARRKLLYGCLRHFFERQKEVNNLIFASPDNVKHQIAFKI
jgi:hypothetical protein